MALTPTFYMGLIKKGRTGNGVECVSCQMVWLMSIDM